MNTVYKVWPEIRKISDVHLRLFLALCLDQSLLYKMSLGFPELFTDQKPEHNGPVPLSAIKVVAQSLQDGVTLDQVSSAYGLPSFGCAHPDSDQINHGAILMPAEISATYGHLLTRYEKTGGFPFDLIRIKIDEVEYYVGWMNSAGVRDDQNHEKDFYMFPCDLVDENA